MTSRILRTDADRAAWVNFLNAQPLPMTVSAVRGVVRSPPQNRTAAKWYAEIGAEIGEVPIVVKAMCKEQFGLLIMERDNPAWVADWKPVYDELSHEQRMKFFQIVPMTRRFTKRQMTEYMNGIQKFYGAQGIALTDPEARKYAA